LSDAGLEVPKLEELLSMSSANTSLANEKVRKVFKLLVNSREIVKVSEEFYFAVSTIDSLTVKIKTFASNSIDRLIDVPAFKEIAGVSRKYAIPLLEYFDREKVTVRAGDKRMIL
ncbi:MAG: SelB domain-containing protein, partial [Blastocatellia bacterium]